MSQSIQAIAPSMAGEPVVGAGFQPTPSNGSVMLLLEKFQHSAAWSAASTFTQNAPERRMRFQRSESIIGRKPTRGGSSDTEVNEPMVNPTGSSPSMPVTTVTPVGKWPST